VKIRFPGRGRIVCPGRDLGFGKNSPCATRRAVRDRPSGRRANRPAPRCWRCCAAAAGWRSSPSRSRGASLSTPRTTSSARAARASPNMYALRLAGSRCCPQWFADVPAAAAAAAGFSGCAAVSTRKEDLVIDDTPRCRTRVRARVCAAGRAAEHAQRFSEQPRRVPPQVPRLRSAQARPAVVPLRLRLRLRTPAGPHLREPAGDGALGPDRDGRGRWRPDLHQREDGSQVRCAAHY
jgi:hypothetical protein